ncbi:MAG: TlpA disulfide reductase family protein [Gemmataceae bacterium]
MNLRGSFLLLALGAGLLAAPGTDSSTETYAQILADYTAALSAFQRAEKTATTPEEKRKTFTERYPHARLYAPRFFRVAQRTPDSPDAVEALAWVISHPVELAAPESALRGQALDLLLKQHRKDTRLGRLCTGLVFTIDADSEKFLREVYAKAPANATQARAAASLAHNLKYRARLIRSLSDDAEMRKEYIKTYGKEAIAALTERDVTALLRESRKLFTQVRDDFGELKHPTHGTLGRLAETHLASIDRPVRLDEPAPEISGTDLNGKALKLSDFRGKVVLLDFGGYSISASHSALEYQRSLVKRLAGKPFVLLGVSCDPDREKAAKQMATEGTAWRVWWDGGHVGGPIATRWEVDTWPTLYLVDARGVVRNVSLGWPDRKSADETIDEMVAEALKANR